MTGAETDLGMVSALLAGISLSAASGLRVFLPLLGVGLASHFGLIELGEGFAWMASEPVLIVVGVAALLEASAYYIPIVDNLLDTVATPAAMAGGTVILSSLMPELSEPTHWATALLLGGGTAGVVQASTVIARGASTATTGGLANPILATVETGGSAIAIVLALLIPVTFGLIAIAAILWLLIRLVVGWKNRSRRESPEDPVI
ncbi:hypothetical protein AY599_10275 [Leptolyngbya valderiana BDU 20041]|nr:hypothetical protein AY599_10275 [Leptolyngbya valderiana BDU 20041]